MTATRTPLTYYGGKQQLAARIVALMPAHRVYLEPFCGGAAVLFAKPRAARETLNDIDSRIVRFWRVLRERPQDLADAVANTPYAREEWRECRYGPEPEDDLEAARRLIVTIDQSFSREGSGWSPPYVLFDRSGRWRPGVWQKLPDKLAAAAHRLAGVAIEHADACDLIPVYDQPDAVIYCDPPYAAGQRLAPESGYRHDDDGTLWPRLVETLGGVRHARVILSGYPCRETDKLGWESVALPRKRSVQARAGGRLGFAPERVWLSPNLHPPLSLFADACQPHTGDNT